MIRRKKNLTDFIPIVSGYFVKPSSDVGALEKTRGDGSVPTEHFKKMVSVGLPLNWLFN